MNRKMEYGEREINLLHLLCYLLERHRSLVIAIAIGTVLSLVTGIVMPERSNTVINISDYKPTETMLEDMEMAFQYRTLYEQQKDYNESSLIMQLNTNKVYTGKAVYCINSFTNEDRLAALYSNVVENKEFLEKTATKSGTETIYLKEILRAERNTANSGEITYTVIHFDKDVCEKLLGCVEEYVDKLQQELKDDGNVHNLEKIVSYVSVGTYPEYLVTQYDNINILNDYKIKKSTFENKFTGNDLLYYQMHYLNEEVGQTEYQKENNIIKSIVIGTAMAALLWGMFWGIRYLMDNRIHTKEESERRYNLPVVGHINTEEKNSLYNNWKKYTFDTEEYLKYTLDSLEEKGVVVSGCYRIELDSENIYCTKEYLWKNQPAMEKAKEIGHVVIGIKLEQSTYSDIEREIEMCIVQDIKISGVLILE